MKTLTQSILITLFLACIANRLTAQTASPNLDQAKLLNQFTGTWQCDISRDTLCTWEIKSFGKGFEGIIRHTAKGKPYYEQKQLWGFDAENKTIYCYYLVSNGTLRLYRGSFISEKKVSMEMLNITGDKVLAKAELILISPDKFTHTTSREGFGQKTITFHIIKK